jgi:hypothetical protein
LAGTEFEVGGVLQVTSGYLKLYADKFPGEIKDIQVKHKARWLHFLHAGSAFPAPLGSYLVHFAGGRTWEIPVIGLADTRSFGYQEGQPLEVRRSVVAWTGRDEQVGKLRLYKTFATGGEFSVKTADEQVGKLRLYKTTWENPWPDLEIETIDLVSSLAWHTMSAFAITLEE